MHNDDVERLKDFLKGELSAVETYDVALKHIKNPSLAATLREGRDSHERRVQILRRELGGVETPSSSGLWGAFAKAVQAGADLLGERAAIAALEQGEDRGMRMYREDLERLGDEKRRLVETDLLPEQQRTHAAMSSLKRRGKAA